MTNTTQLSFKPSQITIIPEGIETSDTRFQSISKAIYSSQQNLSYKTLIILDPFKGILSHYDLNFQTMILALNTKTLVKGVNDIFTPIKETSLGTFFRYSRNRNAHKFPPNWKFPSWMNIPFTGKSVAFEELSKRNLDRTLFEYAGMIDMGTSFKLDPTSPICLNIIDYLQERYGKDLNKFIELWMDAMDIKNGECPIYLYRRLVPMDIKEINNVLYQSILMPKGKDDTLKEQNLTIVKHSVKDLETDEWKTEEYIGRFYQENRIFIPKTKPYVDTDPSTFVTVDALRGDSVRYYGQLLEGSNNPDNTGDTSGRLIAPENITKDALDEDWIPSDEQLNKFIINLQSHGTEITITEQESGYVKLISPYRTHRLEDGKLITEIIPNSDGNLPERKLSDILHFIPIKEWIGYYDYQQQTRIKGFVETNSNTTIKEYTRVSAGTLIEIPRKNDNPKILFIPKGRIPNSQPTKIERKKLLSQPTIPDDIKERLYIWDKKKEEWRTPYNFTTKEGKKVILNPKPGICNKTAWNCYRRAWTKINTFTQLVNEERWEYIALEQNSTIDVKHAPELAYIGIKEECTNLIHLLEQFGIEERILKDFTNDVDTLLQLCQQKIRTQETPSEEIIPNPKCTQQELSRKSPKTVLDSTILTQLRKLYPQWKKKGMEQKLIEWSKEHVYETVPLSELQPTPRKKKIKKIRSKKHKNNIRMAIKIASLQK